MSSFRFPSIDLRINPLKIELDLALDPSNIHELQQQRHKLIEIFETTGITAIPIPDVPQGLRFVGSVGAISQLPGYQAGWWTIQDSSAQLVTHLLDPQPGEVIIDACAAPGGKTTHIKF
jgi:16S rRNA (cytosine967-C5)-methyltransferase